MNAPPRHFLSRRSARRTGAACACLSAAALLAACAGNPLNEAKVDPASPIAGEVARVARANTDYPSFSEIPAVPNDVRPLRMYGRAADELERARLDLERATAPETWTLSNTEAFAAQARRAAGPELAPADPRQSEAYADELRRRATPPPPPKR